MAAAGLCYLIDCFATFLSPSFAAHLLPYILVLWGGGELSLTLWLLVMGVTFRDGRSRPMNSINAANRP